MDFSDDGGSLCFRSVMRWEKNLSGPMHTVDASDTAQMSQKLSLLSAETLRSFRLQQKSRYNFLTRMQVKKLNNLSETFNVKPIKSQLKVAKKLHFQNIF